MGIACPQIVYPYLRANVSDVCTRAGFPPVHLAEINFQAMYEQQQAAGRSRPTAARASSTRPRRACAAGACASRMKSSCSAPAPGARRWPSAPAARHRVALWARDAAQAAAIAAARANERYLPGVALPPTRCRSAPISTLRWPHAAAHDLVIIATPMAALREMLHAPAAGRAGVPGCARASRTAPAALGPRDPRAGRARRSRRRAERPELRAGSGARASRPRWWPRARDAARARQRWSRPSTANLRIYANDDLVGVEVGGAVKNVLAIATGIADGLRAWA